MKKTIIFLIALAMLAGCRPELVILHTNDTHSHLEPERSLDFAGMGGAIERAAFVDSLRTLYGEDNVLLLHAGDWNQGSSYFSELGGSVEVEILNAMRYDAVTLGNHEFDNGLEDLTDRLSRVTCPVVCANLDLRSFPISEYVKPYVILTKAGRRIGIIGLETEIKGVLPSATVDRIPQLDAVSVVTDLADELKNDRKCDLVIVLSHQGFSRDQKIAASTRNVDIIVGGHSHTHLDGMEIVKNLDSLDVRIVTDWMWGLEMGEMHIK